MTRRLLLVVEGSRTMREVLARHLRTLGREVDETDSHAEALRLLERRFASFEDEYSGRRVRLARAGGARRRRAGRPARGRRPVGPAPSS